MPSLDRNPNSSIDHPMSTNNNDTNQTPTKGTTWNDAVLACLKAHEGPIHLADLYQEVRRAAPELVKNNPSWWAPKVRQVLQRLAAKGLVRHVRVGYWEAGR